MSAGVGEVVSSECSACDVLVHWRVVDCGSSRSDWEPLDAPSSFACGHSQEHHEATSRARLNKSGRASSGPVAAKLLTKR
jgi:hypothetical protein